MGIQNLKVAIPAKVIAKYSRDWNDVKTAKSLSTGKVYCSLLDIKIIASVPRDTRAAALTSYLATNFSPRNLLDMTMLIRMAEEELHAIRVRSQNGSATR